MALRFRCGLRVTPSPQSCMHASIKNKSEVCRKAMDIYGDHAVTCGIVAHIFTRHSAVNEILLQAGRAAGYVALSEQVILELMQKRTELGEVQKFREARVDVELFGHPIVPDRILDGTVRHPAAANIVKKRVCC